MCEAEQVSVELIKAGALILALGRSARATPPAGGRAGLAHVKAMAGLVWLRVSRAALGEFKV